MEMFQMGMDKSWKTKRCFPQLTHTQKTAEHSHNIHSTTTKKRKIKNSLHDKKALAF